VYVLYNSYVTCRRKIPDCEIYKFVNDGPEVEKTTIYKEIEATKSTQIVLASFSNSWPPFLNRKKELYKLSDKLKKLNISLILIQICEAHTEKWPIGLDASSQVNFEDRVDRARNLIKSENVPYPVLVDSWDNTFESIFQSWPDKYYIINNNMIIQSKSEYNAHKNAVVNIDILDYLHSL